MPNKIRKPHAENQERRAFCSRPRGGFSLRTLATARRPRFTGPAAQWPTFADLTYWAATFLDLPAAISLSITARQPVLSLALFLIMQAVIFGMFGISELQRRKASPVHWAAASEL
jgi:hypothetical protein